MKQVILAVALVGLSTAALAQAQPRPPAPPPEPAAARQVQPRPPAPPPEPPAAPLSTVRAELGAAWDAGDAAEQRKKNAVVGMINAINASVAGTQKQIGDLTAQHERDVAEIARLNNAIAAEKRAETIKHNPELKKHPSSITNDKGAPLMLERPPQSVPTKR